jgi:hypothetical protein
MSLISSSVQCFQLTHVLINHRLTCLLLLRIYTDSAFMGIEAVLQITCLRYCRNRNLVMVCFEQENEFSHFNDGTCHIFYFNWNSSPA